jgi:hypothetical protein
MNTFVYDIEMYPNLFFVLFYDVDTREYHKFEISPRKNDTENLARFLARNKGCTLIGFNNVSYDYPLLHYFILQLKRKLSPQKLVASLYKKSNQLIKISSTVNKPLFKNIDLLLINHFNNKAKMVSLKELQFNLRMENIQELPYKFDTVLTKNQIEEITLYCLNDVKATYLFYLECVDSIKFREKMSAKYNMDFTNYNDVKIGEAILIDALSKKMNLPREVIESMRTRRSSMSIKEIIVPYVKFFSEPLKAFTTWWKTKVITETKGQFSKIPIADCQDILQYTNGKLCMKNTMLKKLNIIHKGFQFDFGTGGIHGILRPGVWKSDKDTELILVDVSSYYPNLCSKNGFHPAHFPKDIFIAVIDMLYQQRMQGKLDGDNEIVKAIKLALNGALYGKSNDIFSCMYDPQMMMSVCVNGQLLLVMLAEKLIDTGFEVIQINTDGILLSCKKKNKSKLDIICNNWMNLTKLKLDYDYFDLVVQKDCNNYIARYTNGKIKRKGAAFSYKLEWHKNHSSLVIQKAVEQYFLHDIPVETFIRNHKNIYDFMLRVKLNKGSKLYAITDNEKLEMQKITRYFVAKEGNFIFQKELPPKNGKQRFTAVEKDYYVIPCNDLSSPYWSDDYILSEINFDYYITKAKNIIEACMNLQ